ncbi:hypothetical protein I547_5487 [Mycobacterium kansasii 824]|uniref:Uncharacterized protein n=1 Tax=Mycobacterium kansasii TaxID=1768 RepID=A0A1V3XDK4_MYCKA|nr:hypothetical protein I547_5487 [Mycobacterium kansasii 824]OOK73430.1 hypothetical protein BZL30_5039 [Mycobacterium kansasii]OOK77309.1 hypothetical protein BZL29_3752 [Mycobacterium kansasii]
MLEFDSSLTGFVFRSGNGQLPVAGAVFEWHSCTGDRRRHRTSPGRKTQPGSMVLFARSIVTSPKCGGAQRRESGEPVQKAKKASGSDRNEMLVGLG